MVKGMSSQSPLHDWKQRPLGAIIRDFFRLPPDTSPQPTESVPDDALPLCHKCLERLAPGTNFCPSCNAAVGPYNTWMPLEQISSIGEVARSGVEKNARFTTLNTIGYILFGLIEYSILAPIYFIRLLVNYLGQGKENTHPNMRMELDGEPAPASRRPPEDHPSA